jgi:hypothetical protein
MMNLFSTTQFNLLNRPVFLNPVLQIRQNPPHINRSAFLRRALFLLTILTLSFLLVGTAFAQQSSHQRNRGHRGNNHQTTGNNHQIPTARVNVRYILGNSSTEQQMDSSLSGISGQLRSRFSTFHSFRQIGSLTLNLTQGSAQNISMPNGQTMQIALEGQQGNAYRIRIAIPGGSSTVTVPSNENFFVAGPRHQGSSLIISLGVH